MIPSSKKARARNRIIKELDALARQKCFERDGFKCVRCGTAKHLQWAHVVSRRHLHLRWAEGNHMTLCAGCHLWWHHEPLLAVKWFIEMWPARYDELLVASFIKKKVDLKELLVSLRSGL